MKTYIDGLIEAHRLIREQHKTLSAKLKSTPKWFVFRLTAEHHEIKGASNALYELATKISHMVVQEAYHNLGMSIGAVLTAACVVHGLSWSSTPEGLVVSNPQRRPPSTPNDPPNEYLIDEATICSVTVQEFDKLMKDVIHRICG